MSYLNPQSSAKYRVFVDGPLMVRVSCRYSNGKVSCCTMTLAEWEEIQTGLRLIPVR